MNIIIGSSVGTALAFVGSIIIIIIIIVTVGNIRYKGQYCHYHRNFIIIIISIEILMHNINSI